MKFGVVLRTLGLISIIISATMLWPMGWSIYFSGPDIPAFLISIAIGVLGGLLLMFFTRKCNYQDMGIREAFAVVTLSWVVASAVGGLPFYIGKLAPTYTDAFFEAMSGFTTTGATILSEIESLPKGLLFWRSLTHWLGGMGIIVLGLAILPFIGVGGMQLYKAEVPGPTPEKLTPRIQQTAMLLWGAYVALSVAEVIALLLCGMNFYDSLTHTFGTVATGGFSPRNASIAAYGSPLIEWVITVFMFLAGTNFVLHYMALKGKLSAFWKDEEFRFYTRFTVITIAVVSLVNLGLHSGDPVSKVIRDASFQVVSIMTTTGYTTVDYAIWPVAAKFILLLLMFFGGCSGSTGGSIKQMRIQIMFKRIKKEINQLLHPQQIMKIRFNNQVLQPYEVSSVTSFVLLYVMLFVIFSLVMIIVSGLDLVSGAASVAATLGNIGPGLGAVGPVMNYGFINIAGKWILSFCMLLGRLEIFSVIMLFVPGIWRK